MKRTMLRGRRGMTLIELLTALVIGGIILQVVLTFFAQQGRAFDRGVATMGALQNARYALNSLEKDLRTLGTGLAPWQPELVYAGPDVVAFNADYLAREETDLFAVYVDTAAPPSQARSLTPGQRITVPLTIFGYPDTTYMDGEVIGGAETLVFFFQPDPTTPRADDFVLYRQVNATDPTVVARNLLQSGGAPFLEYLYLMTSDTAPARLAPWQGGPMAHVEPLHGSAADADAAPPIDQVRAVRIRFTAVSVGAGGTEQRRAYERVVRLPNAGLPRPKVCGDEPQLGTGIGAWVAADANGVPIVQLAWNPASDEGGGERDVLRYLVWRRTGGGDMGQPYITVPAGADSYLLNDRDVVPGTSYQYLLAAQDCTPTLSSLATSVTVTIP